MRVGYFHDAEVRSGREKIHKGSEVTNKVPGIIARIEDTDKDLLLACGDTNSRIGDSEDGKMALT